MSQINIRNLSNENDDGSPDIVGVSTFSATSYIVPPKGTTLERPKNPQPGDLRFNTDCASLEYFRGDAIGWTQVEMTSPDLDGGARGCIAGGAGPVKDNIDYITITTLGNGIDFGNLTQAKFGGAGGGSRTRGVYMGGGTPTRLDEIDFITFASTGNAQDFGDCDEGSRSQGAGCSNQIRAIYAGGSSPAGVKALIDYVTIATTGSGADFGGDLAGASETQGGCQSSTRGVISGGSANNNTIQYITLMTGGNAIDFGDLDVNRNNLGGNQISSATRGVIAGGSPALISMSYLTIATLGNASDFGDMTENLSACSCVDDSVRGVITGGGDPAGDAVNTMTYIHIATLGNAKDFGDLITATRTHMSTSNAHGGL